MNKDMLEMAWDPVANELSWIGPVKARSSTIRLHNKQASPTMSPCMIELMSLADVIDYLNQTQRQINSRMKPVHTETLFELSSENV